MVRVVKSLRTPDIECVQISSVRDIIIRNNHLEVDRTHGKIYKWALHTMLIYFPGNRRVFPGFPGNKIPGNTATLACTPMGDDRSGEDLLICKNLIARTMER